MSERTIGPGGIIKGIFGVQIAMAAILFAADMGGALPGFGGAPEAPQLDQPVRPGDQTRRYRPDRLPKLPGTTPFPVTEKMPARLTLSVETLDQAPVLRLTGQIAPGDGERIADQLMARRGEADTVYLHSPGGSVGDALEIGRTIRAEGLAAAVASGDVCLSACPYLLAGGTERSAGADAVIGIHQHYFGENSVLPAFLAVEDVQRGQGAVLAYLDEMGIDPMLLQPALMTPPDEIYVLVPDEMQRYALVTSGQNKS